MRYILFVFLCVTQLDYSALAQDNKYIIEAGFVYGSTDDFFGLNGDGVYNPSWSVKVGKTHAVSSTFSILWGMRYSRIPYRDYSPTYSPLSGAQHVFTRSRLQQHYLSLPVHFQHHLKQFYLFLGPEIGFAIRSSLSTDRYWIGENGPEEEHEVKNVTGAFSDINAMITIGIGTEWRIGNRVLYSQLSIGQTVLSQDVINVRYRSGFTRDYFFSTGIRL